MKRLSPSVYVLAAPCLTMLAVGAPQFAVAALPGTALTLLQNASATFSQEGYGGYPVGEVIDGDLSGISHGWAIARNDNLTNPETAVFETVVDLTVAGPITFQLHQLHSDPIAQHTLGRFRLSVTGDSRDDFADGFAADGDVAANWTVLQPLSAESTHGVIVSILDDKSVLPTGPNPAIATYTITALAPYGGITGFRLETLADLSLPFDGPGRQPTNGNFVLTEFQVYASPVPEPVSRILGVTAFGILQLRRRPRIHTAGNSRTGVGNSARGGGDGAPGARRKLRKNRPDVSWLFRDHFDIDGGSCRCVPISFALRQFTSQQLVAT